MRARSRIAVLACLPALAGCGGTTRIAPQDDGRYEMTVYALPVVIGPGGLLLGRAWKEAGDLCAAQGKTLQPVPEANQDPARVDRTAYAQASFKCADPEFIKRQMK
jgi:hypothetical protein